MHAFEPKPISKPIEKKKTKQYEYMEFASNDRYVWMRDFKQK